MWWIFVLIAGFIIVFCPLKAEVSTPARKRVFLCVKLKYLGIPLYKAAFGIRVKKIDFQILRVKKHGFETVYSLRKLIREGLPQVKETPVIESIKLKALDAAVTVGLADAAHTALAYGALAAVLNAAARLAKNDNICITLNPNFEEVCFRARIHCIIGITIADIIKNNLKRRCNNESNRKHGAGNNV